MSQLLQEMRTRLVVDPTVMMKSDSEISSIHSNETDSQLETAILVRQNMSIEIARGKKETSIFHTNRIQNKIFSLGKVSLSLHFASNRIARKGTIDSLAPQSTYTSMILSTASVLSARRSFIHLRRLPTAWNAPSRTMATIVEGVEFDTIAREWRCKWSTDNDKKSLVELQQTLNDSKGDLKAIDGLKSVQRVVCGGCLDFKVVIALDGDKFGEWEESSFAPEEGFLEKIKQIDGVSTVETQTYTLMPVDL